MMSETYLEEQDTDQCMEHNLHEVFNPKCSTCYSNHMNCKWCAKSLDGKIGRTISDDGDEQYSLIACSNPENYD